MGYTWDHQPPSPYPFYPQGQRNLRRCLFVRVREVNAAASVLSAFACAIRKLFIALKAGSTPQANWRAARELWNNLLCRNNEDPSLDDGSGFFRHI